MNGPACSIESFPALDALPFVRAVFIGRAAGMDVRTDRETALARLAGFHQAARAAAGFRNMPLATAEQVHGNLIARVGEHDHFPVPGNDGLVTIFPGLCLGIYVADCAAVYLAARNGRGIALVHAGRKGTELGIVPRAITALCDASGSEPHSLVAQISPCIRPPHYETDFAAEITEQARRSGVRAIHDCGTCTASAPDAYYSYRREKGSTGRMLALMAILPPKGSDARGH